MALSKNDVQSIAALARLDLSEAEMETMRHDLEHILKYIDQLHEVDVAGVIAADTSGVHDVMADDVPAPFTNREALLDAAPVREGDYVKVKTILGKAT